MQPRIESNRVEFMEREKIIFLRNFFFRAFIIGVAFGLFYFIVAYAFWNTWATWVARWFKVDEKELSRLLLLFFMQLRIVLVFLFLVPALALHWMAKKLTFFSHGLRPQHRPPGPSQEPERRSRISKADRVEFGCGSRSTSKMRFGNVIRPISQASGVLVKPIAERLGTSHVKPSLKPC
jgi:hypothetical protein